MHTDAKQLLGRMVLVKMDRPLGSKHPRHGYVYPVNYGFLPETKSPDGEELDAYVLGVDVPLEEFSGRCIAVVHRLDDDDDKLIVVPDGQSMTDDEIRKATHFQEQYFKSEVIRNEALYDKGTPQTCSQDTEKPNTRDRKGRLINTMRHCIDMQPFIIFEGIASSGKTTLERMFQEKLEGSVIVSEGQTLMPLIENKEPRKAVEHLSVVLDEIEEQPAKAYIVDRFHLTHAFRTSASLSLFGEIEKRISEQRKPLIVLLQMDEEVISDRIKETATLRGTSWAKGKQGSLEEKVAYYKDQQRKLVELIKQSNLPVVIVDTSDKDWPRCMTEIQGALEKDNG